MGIREELHLFHENDKYRFCITKSARVFRISKSNEDTIYQYKICKSGHNDSFFYFVKTDGIIFPIAKLMFDTFFKLKGEYKDYWCIHKDDRSNNFHINNLKFILKITRKNLDNPNVRKVILFNLNEKKAYLYNSVSKLSDAIGLSPNYLSKIANSTKRLGSLPYKNRIMFYDEYLKLKEERGKTKCAN